MRIFIQYEPRYNHCISNCCNPADVMQHRLPWQLVGILHELLLIMNFDPFFPHPQEPLDPTIPTKNKQKHNKNQISELSDYQYIYYNSKKEQSYIFCFINKLKFIYQIHIYYMQVILITINMTDKLFLAE